MPLHQCKRGKQYGWKWGHAGKCYVGPGARKKALKQAAAMRYNAKRPLMLDPTRSIVLRRQFSNDVAQRFNKLRRALWQLVVVEDAFGLKSRKHTFPTNQEQDDGNQSDTGRLYLQGRDQEYVPDGKPPEDQTQLWGEPNPLVVPSANLLGHDYHPTGPTTANTRYAFLSTPDQIAQFDGWLKAEMQQDVLGGVATVQEAEQGYWTHYVNKGYAKGSGRAFDDVRKPYAAGFAKAGADVSDFYAGTRAQFLASAFARPVAVQKVRLLAGRVYSDLKGVTEQMGSAISRELTDGLVRGESPLVVGRRLNKIVDGYKNRGKAIARTETIRAHAEGQLDAMEELGVEEVGVMVEWSAAYDDRTCEICADLDGVVMPIKEAHGSIPVHPNCRCAFIPSTPGRRGEAGVRTGRELTAEGEVITTKITPRLVPSGKSAIDKTLRRVSRIKRAARAAKAKPAGPPPLPAQEAQKIRLTAARIEEMITGQPQSVPQLAEQLGTTPEKLISHLRKLEGKGKIVYEKGWRKGGIQPLRTRATPILPAPEGSIVGKVNLVSGADTAEANVVTTEINRVAARYPKFKARVGQGKVDVEVHPRTWKNVRPDKTVINASGEYDSLHKGNPLLRVAKTSHGKRGPLRIGQYTVDPTIEGVTRHELGHHLYFKGLDVQEKIALDQLWQRGAKSVSGQVSTYAKTDSGEMLAEAFSAYTHPKYRSGMLPKPIEQFVASLLE